MSGSSKTPGTPGSTAAWPRPIPRSCADDLALERLRRDLYVVAHKGKQDNWNPKQACKDVKAELKSLKDAQAAYVQASNADLAWTLRDTLRGFLDAYESAKRERAVVDFAGLLLEARDVLARSVPVRRYFQRRFDFILIDEFQDTDPLQAQIAFFLAEDPTAEPAADWRGVRLAPGKLFVVGDPKQGIYRFRRAGIAIYQEVKRLIEASGGEVLPLTANFRTVPSVLAVPIRALAAAVAEVDPMGAAEFAVAVPSALLESLRPGGEVAVREAGHETVTTRFRTPRAVRVPTKPSYDLDPDDPDRLACDFAAADHQHRTLESERQELKERMRAWMEHARRMEWGHFVISDSAPRLTTDVRGVAEWLRDEENRCTGLPSRFLQAFAAPQVAALSEYVEAAATPVLRWRPDRTTLPIDIAQSRDWHGEHDGS